MSKTVIQSVQRAPGSASPFYHTDSFSVRSVPVSLSFLGDHPTPLLL
jgi:hypothetical protein